MIGIMKTLIPFTICGFFLILELSCATSLPMPAGVKELSPSDYENLIQQKTKKMTLDKSEVYKNAERIYHPD